MNYSNQRKHVVDILFIIALFCVFTLSSLLVVIIGVDVYKSTVSSMNSNYEARTSVSYIMEKVRQNDSYDSIEINNFNGKNVLTLNQTYNSEIYCTYLYEDDGYLKELFANKDLEFNPVSGQEIIEINDFYINQMSNTLIKFIVTTPDNTEYEFYSAIISD